MKRMKRSLLALRRRGALAAGAAHRRRSPTTSIKIGVLTDMSSLYADLAGPGSVVAAQMAVEDFGQREARHARSRSSRPTTRTSPTSARASRASGSTPTRST